MIWTGDLGKTGRSIVRWGKNKSILAQRGFKVTELLPGFGSDRALGRIAELSKEKELYGFYIFGHGFTGGVGTKPWLPGPDKNSQLVLYYKDIAARLSYKPAFLFLNVCFGDRTTNSANPPLNPFNKKPIISGRDLLSADNNAVFYAVNDILYPVSFISESRNSKYVWEVK